MIAVLTSGLAHATWMVIDASDEYYRAATFGVWAGAYARVTVDDGWNLRNHDDTTLPKCSARTLLLEAEMRPTLWLRWKDDPTCQMAWC